MPLLDLKPLCCRDSDSETTGNVLSPCWKKMSIFEKNVIFLLVRLSYSSRLKLKKPRSIYRSRFPGQKIYLSPLLYFLSLPLTHENRKDGSVRRNVKHDFPRKICSNHTLAHIFETLALILRSRKSTKVQKSKKFLKKRMVL